MKCQLNQQSYKDLLQRRICPAVPKDPFFPPQHTLRRRGWKTAFFSFHSPSLPDTCKHTNAHGDLLPTADLLFIHVPVTHSSPIAAPGTPESSHPHLTQSPVATPGALSMGQAPATRITSLTSITDKAFRLFSQAWRFLGAGAASSVSSPFLQGFFSVLFKWQHFQGGPKGDSFPWLLSTEG